MTSKLQLLHRSKIPEMTNWLKRLLCQHPPAKSTDQWVHRHLRRQQLEHRPRQQLEHRPRQQVEHRSKIPQMTNWLKRLLHRSKVLSADHGHFTRPMGFSLDPIWKSCAHEIFQRLVEEAISLHVASMAMSRHVVHASNPPEVHA